MNLESNVTTSEYKNPEGNYDFQFKVLNARVQKEGMSFGYPYPKVVSKFWMFIFESVFSFTDCHIRNVLMKLTDINI